MKTDRIVLLAVMLFSMTALCGCMDVKNMTEEESDMVAEYSAGVLLRYSDTYPWRLVTEKQAEEMGETPTEVPSQTSEPLPTSTPVPSTAHETTAPDGKDQTQAVTIAEETTAKKVSPEEVLRVRGIRMRFKGVSLCRVYQNIQVPAGADEKLLVAEFELQNTTSSAKKVNLMKRKLEYPLEINGQIYQTGINLLKGNDLNYLDVRTGAKKTVKAVLIYNLPASVAKRQMDGTLTVRDTVSRKEASYGVSIG